MGCILLGRWACGISQWRVTGTPAMRRGVLTETLLPGREVDRAGIGSEHHELRKRQPRAISNVGRGRERGRAIAREPEDERAEDMHAMIAECAQARDQCLANVVEALVHVLEAFRRDGLHADECPLILARRMAVRNAASSAASMVIWVKNTMSDGSCASRSISSNRSVRNARSCSSRTTLPWRSAIARSANVTG